MKKICSVLYALGILLAVCCTGSTTKQVEKEGRDTSTAEDLRLRAEKLNPDGPDEYLEVKSALISTVLEKQLREGANVYDDYADRPKEVFGIDELKAVTVELSNVFLNADYIDIGEVAFARKVKEIFGRTLPADAETPFLYLNLLEDCDEKPVYKRNNGVDYNGFFIALQEHFITDFYYLPEIIDYQTEYPDLAKMEQEMPSTVLRDQHGLEVRMEKWMDMENLQKNNRLLALNRNRFLFNGDDGKLPWLLQHDRFFMESLVKRFGWTGHGDLLRHVVMETRFNQTNPDDFGRLFWLTDCRGGVKIHANTFKLLQRLHNPGDSAGIPHVLADIQAYLEYMMGYQDQQCILPITETQRMEILANMVYFAEQYKYKKLANGKQGSSLRMMGRLRFMLGEEQVKVLADNHYFGLPQFKSWWDAADYDAYYASGDYEGPWGRDNEPLTEKAWRMQ